MGIKYFFSVLFDYLSSFAEFDSAYTSVVLPLLISIIAAFIYDKIKKRDTRAAEDFVYDSMCQFVKRGKIPNGNLMETLINEAARKYRLEVGNLPAPEVFVERAKVNILKDSLYNVEEMREHLDLLEYIKNRCRRSCITNFLIKVNKWVEFWVFITIVFVLVFVLFISFGFIRFYEIAFSHLVLLLILIAFLILFRIILCLSNPRKKKHIHEENESACKKFIRILCYLAPSIVVALAVLMFVSLYDLDVFHWILLSTLIGFLLLFYITLYFSNMKEEELLHNEIINAWKRYIEKGNEEADNEHWQLASICYYKAMESYPASEIDEYDYGKMFILQGKALANLGEERLNEALDLLEKGLEHIDKREAGKGRTCVELAREIKLKGEAYCNKACIYAKIESKTNFMEVLANIKKLDNSIQESVFNELESWLQKNIKNPGDYIKLMKQSKTQEK